MEVKNMTTTKIEAEINKCKKNIDCYTEILGHLPVESVLGRWSIKASIKIEERKLYKLKKELELRIDRVGFDFSKNK